MLLLTTPDYLPKFGGLTSHTLNVEKVLRELGIEYELFHWKSYQDIIKFPKEKLRSYDYILNIHSGFHMYMPGSEAKVVNFICGAEILFYSPNRLKHLIKQVLRRKGIQRLEAAHQNIFISEFTFKMLGKKGLRPDYGRDIIHHMCVDTSAHQPVSKHWEQGRLKFICVARDVPHKNFAGALKFCETVSDISGREVELITLSNAVLRSEKVRVSSILNADNAERDRLLKSSHLNLLFSLDHSKKGFFEGFGQIVQEAGCFSTPSVVLATGGLPESVHHAETGWVLEDLDYTTIETWWKGMTPENYEQVSARCYRHTLESHGLNNWTKLFGALLVP